MAKKVEIDFWNQLTMLPTEAGAYTGLGKDAIEVLLEKGWLRCMYKGTHRLIWRKDLEELPPRLIDKQIDLTARSIVDL